MTKKPGLKIIDAHNHPDWHGHDFDRYIENMDRFGIRQTWILPWECPRHEYLPLYDSVTVGRLLGDAFGPIPFARCLAYKERAPERFVLGFCPDPRQPDACARLQAAHSIHGARVCGELKIRMTYDSPDALRLFRLAGTLGMPVVLHLQYDFQPTHDKPWTEWFGGSIEALERALAACPETNFLGHAPGFWIHVSKDDLHARVVYPEANAPVVAGGEVPRLLRRYPNLFCDLSAGSGCLALARDPSHARGFLDEFQDRVLYARDYFDNRHQEFIESLGLSLAIRRKLYAENAERLIRDSGSPRS